MSEVDDKVFNYMVEFQDAQSIFPVGPTARQIVEHLGLSGPGYVDKIWTRMERQGRVGKAPGRSAHDRFAIFHPTPLEEAQAEAARWRQMASDMEDALIDAVADADKRLSSVMENVTAALALVREGDLVNSADVLARIVEE